MMQKNTYFLKKIQLYAVFLMTVLMSASSAVASQDLVIPKGNQPIVDQAFVFPGRQKQMLTDLLLDFNSKGKAQIGILTLASLNGLGIEELSIKVAEQWKLGSEKGDNGIIILLAPNDKKVRIEVGQGLEGVIPDAYAKRILAEVARPYFKKGLYADGLSATVMQLISYIDKDYAQSGQQIVSADIQEGFPYKALIFFIVFFIVFPILSSLSGSSGRRFGRRGPFIGGYGGGGWGGSSGGGWSGGGGGFSGGGASDGW